VKSGAAGITEMVLFDQLRKNDGQLRLLAAGILCGLLILAGGLWWIQIVRARDFQASMETQHFRTVRVPALRGMNSTGRTSKFGVDTAPSANGRPAVPCRLLMPDTMLKGSDE